MQSTSRLGQLGALNTSQGLCAFVDGHLRIVPTRSEAQSQFVLVDVLVVLVPLRNANAILKKLDNTIGTAGHAGLQHLRRCVKVESFPAAIKDRLLTSIISSTADKPAPSLYRLQSGNKSLEPMPNHSGSLFLLLGPASRISISSINEILSDIYTIGGIGHTSVPAVPPWSEADAAGWSTKYWPTIYKKHHPGGPHPSIIARAEECIKPMAHEWLRLAAKIGVLGREEGFGEQIGAVIVDNNTTTGPQAIVVAADVRFYDTVRECNTNHENPINHATMRAIALVARKRLNLLPDPSQQPCRLGRFEVAPLPLEKEIFDASVLKPGGYLCTGLDLYITHEPCVMCSMAIIHSRFDRVVIGMRVPPTGAVSPEGPAIGLGYGLFWRPELNWKILVWDWHDNDNHKKDVATSLHA